MADELMPGAYSKEPETDTDGYTDDEVEFAKAITEHLKELHRIPPSRRDFDSLPSHFKKALLQATKPIHDKIKEKRN